MKPESIDDALLLSQFAELIADHWTSGFRHSYSITRHQAWDGWRALHHGRDVPWSCDSLAQAAARWCWTKSSFAELADGLRQAIIAHDETAAEQLCYRIYLWGGVARTASDRSRVWVREAAAGRRLITALTDAVALLSPDAMQSLDRFNADDLLMTSATTKLYAAAATDGRVAINDGRVGAALGLLARKFLEARRIDQVPDILHFMWGPPQGAKQAAARTRDPSSERHAFRQLPYGSASHRVRAELSRRTNALFQAVIERLAGRKIHATFLELEQALFMIGYCVR
jgi:hypothetical protein